MSRERLFDLDRAKGLGIFLVVLGHVVAREYPSDVSWYPILKERIYLFHMPFFMFVAGAIAGYTWKPISTLQDYMIFVKRRAERLLPAYFIFALIVFVGKLVAQSLTPRVDNPVKSVWSFFDVIIMPYQSFSAYLWFIFVLFLLYAALPILLWMARGRFLWLLVFAAVVQFLPATPYFGIASFKEYLFVFLLGFVIMQETAPGVKFYDLFTQHLDKWWWVWVFVFVLGLVITQKNMLGDIFHFGKFKDFQPYKIIFGLLSIPVLLGFVRSAIANRSQFLLTLGTYTFVIYLMNTMAIGTVKALGLKFVAWDGVNFYFYAPILLMAGLYLPIMIKKHFFRRVAYLDKITN